MKGRVLVRAEARSDRAAIHALNCTAFPTPAEADLVDVLRNATEPLISLVAEDGEQIVGHILFTPVTLDGDAVPRIMGLAPMAVVPARQRQKIGSALVCEGLERCRMLGFDAAVVLGHPDYYPRFGFHQSIDFGISSEYNVPAEVFMAMELQPLALANCEGQVRYHPAFASV